MEITENEHKNCYHCDSKIASTSSFCNVCGKFQDPIDLTHLVERKQHLKHVGIFIGIELLICLAALIVKDRNLFVTLGFDVILIVTSVFFFATLGKKGLTLLKWSNFSILKLLAIISLTIISAYFVNKIVSWLNPNIFHFYELPYNLQYEGYKYGNYILILSMAIIPAIFEELAYRGYLMEKLLKIMGKEETVYLSSFIFFLMHLSIASIFWLLPFAIILAKIRLKENSLWLGIILHFFFNFTSCMIDIYSSDLNLLLPEL